MTAGHQRAGAAALLVALAVAAGCGTTDRVAEAEEGIAAALAQRLAVDEVRVSCPDDAELDDGSTLACDVAVGGGDPQPVAFTIGSGGAVSPAVAVIPTTSVEEYLASELAVAAEGEVVADCGGAALVVHDVGETFTCTVDRVSDGARFEVTVEVRSLDGSVTYSVATTTTTTAPITTPADPAATTVPP